jgi:hypothetical protein
MNRYVRTLSFVCLAFFGAYNAGRAQTNFCGTLPQTATCSYANINGSCQVNVDRANAISLPTIYMKPGSNLTVVVYNATPLESLTLDLSGYTSALRPDVVQTIFNSATPNAAKAIASRVDTVANRNALPIPVPSTSLKEVEAQAEKVIYEQNTDLDEVDASLVLAEVAVAARGMTSQSCFLSPETTTDQFPNPWFRTEEWKAVIQTRIANAKAGTAKTQTQLQQDADTVSPKMASVADLINAWNFYSNPNNPGHGTLNEDSQRILDHANLILKAFRAQQISLKAKIAQRKDNGNAHSESDRLADLSSTVDLIPKQDPPRSDGDPNMTTTFVVNNPKGIRAFNVSGSWALNFTNVLSGIITQVSQTSYTPLSGQVARQRPGTAEGFIFLSLEDETGISNAIIHPGLYERNRVAVTRG